MKTESSPITSYNSALEAMRPAYTVPFLTSPHSTYFFDAEWKEIGYWNDVVGRFHPATHYRAWGGEALEEAKSRATVHFYNKRMEHQKLTSDTITAFLNAPYALWSQLRSSSLLGNRNTQDLIRELDALLERAAMLRGYLDTRQNSQGSDLGHDKAVKAANSIKTKVRRALGYTIPRQDVSF